ncbi:MAG: Cypemycin methyltransferase [Planctomycetota bacterium]|jgi:SAM-dependent methyltransferase
MRSPVDPYDVPMLWDLAFRDETIPEAEFLTAAAQKYLGVSTPTTLEIGCGGGRQVLELCRRGWHVSAIDLNTTCVRHVQRRIARAGGSASVFCADMREFRLPGRYQLAHCLVNTFRHLLCEADARRHLECVASHLVPGGLYVLGLHLLPPDAEEYDCERWTVEWGGKRLTTTVRVLEFSRRRREELLRFSLHCRDARGVRRLRAEHWLRIYRADQIRRLFRSVAGLRLAGVYDFCYDITQPLPLNDELGDAVFVLQRE